MKMICDVPNEVIESVRMGTWCGSSVAEKMIANGIPLEQTGKWEEIVKEHKCYAMDDTYTTTEYHCSECGEEPFVNEDGFYELSNYCPNCGCRMVEPRESEDKE